MCGWNSWFLSCSYELWCLDRGWMLWTHHAQDGDGEFVQRNWCIRYVIINYWFWSTQVSQAINISWYWFILFSAAFGVVDLMFKHQSTICELGWQVLTPFPNVDCSNDVWITILVIWKLGFVILAFLKYFVNVRWKSISKDKIIDTTCCTIDFLLGIFVLIMIGCAFNKGTSHHLVLPGKGRRQ